MNNTGTQVGSIGEGAEQAAVENISFNLQVQQVPAIQKEKVTLGFGEGLGEAEGLCVFYPPITRALPSSEESRRFASPRGGQAEGKGEAL